MGWLWIWSRNPLHLKVINQRPNIRRKDYDKLKAILFNAIRLGAQSQFFSSELERPMRQLQGKIDWVTLVNPERGARLKQLYDQVNWPEEQWVNATSWWHL
jgi:RNA-directed DNA polymerase